MSKLPVGVMGCGAISKTYLKNLTTLYVDEIEVAAVADVIPESAKTRGEEHGIARILTPDELLKADDIPLVLNLTPAPAHYEVARGILQAGKHVYSEKPLALTMEHGRELVDLAKQNGLMLSVAPDTILGAGVQSLRALIDAGEIGEPIVGHAFVSLGVKSERYYTVFRGPLLDMAPYFVGALLNTFGPVKSVSGTVRPTRFLDEGHVGRSVDAPANSAAVLEFASGCLVTLIATSEIISYMPFLKLWGTEGIVTGTDPNTFGGKLLLHRRGEKEAEASLPHAFEEHNRGIGVVDMARALREGRAHRLSPDLALHGLEVMLSVIESSKTGRRIDLTTTCTRPEPMPATPTQPAGAE